MHLHDLAGVRQMLNLPHHESGDRLVVPVLRQGDAELVRHFIGRRPTGQQPGAVLTSDGLRLSFGLIRSE